MSRLKEIVVVSGKGGTGKTTVTASLAAMMTPKVLVDTDVDAANLHILMKPEILDTHDFTGKPAARILPDKCVSCGRCLELCRFHAVAKDEASYRIDPYSCEGCGLCRSACPEGAVVMEERVVGQWYESRTPGGEFFFARLTPGAENSGSLVAKVRERAQAKAREQGIDTLLIDGPPGIGCPAIASLSGASLALIVTEPTFSAIGDLKRLLDLTRHFKIWSALVVNRFDINLENTEEIETFARDNLVPVLGKIPHSPCVLEAITLGRIPAQDCPEFAKKIEQIYNRLSDITSSTAGGLK